MSKPPEHKRSILRENYPAHHSRRVGGGGGGGGGGGVVPISEGGTGATTAAGARDNLDVAQKQSSLIDATPGRGLLVGGFGLGTLDPPTVSELQDNSLPNGFYEWGSGATDSPSAFGALLALSGQTSWNFRLAFGTDKKVYYSSSINGAAWDAWKELGKQEIYTGSNQAQLNFPVGHIIACTINVAIPDRNGAIVPELYATNNYVYVEQGGGGILAGVWRSRGIVNETPVIALLQRTE